MPRRKPLNRLLTEGADLKNPRRFRDRRRPITGRPVGEPYVSMTDAERRHWRELVGSCPWITARHRVLLRLTCTLAARLESGELTGLTAVRTLTGLLAKLGATPTDEAKVAQGADDDDADPSETFFRGSSRAQ